MSYGIDVGWLIRHRLLIPGSRTCGTVNWTFGGKPAGWISYSADMTDLSNSLLLLSCSFGPENDRKKVEQTVRLVSTQPNYGGRRWWMLCPYSGARALKLYLPNGGDRFASRTAWKLSYSSQRVGRRERPFCKLFRLQRKLGCDEGWQQPLYRPKGMHRQTYERHLARYRQLDRQCDIVMTGGPPMDVR